MPSDLPRAVAMIGNDVEFLNGQGTPTPAIYRTFVRHAQGPAERPSLEYRGYSWVIDVDRTPSAPWWLRMMMRFEPWDHFVASDSDTFRGRVEDQLVADGVRVPGGRITALLNIRRVGFGSDPLNLFWCHARNGSLACVVAEVHPRRGGRHCYTLRSDEIDIVARDGDMFAVSVAVRRPGVPVFTATVSGERLPVQLSTVLRARMWMG
ncbi:DUF1365 family protein [Rhodococcus sp. NPDC047139]|jgi:DUF1365 family protein|uniref:DUF1365 family protein n=1 Tax=Rhodococcus sp. NPDC047139 TaxID=3155141 RepID=UPI0033C1C0A0